MICKINTTHKEYDLFIFLPPILVTELEKGQDKWPVLVPKLVKDLNMRRGIRGYSHSKNVLLPVVNKKKMN